MVPKTCISNKRTRRQGYSDKYPNVSESVTSTVNTQQPPKL